MRDLSRYRKDGACREREISAVASEVRKVSLLEKAVELVMKVASSHLSSWPIPVLANAGQRASCQ